MAAGFGLLGAPAALSDVVYVDTTLRRACDSYAVEARACGAGEARAVRTFSAAMGVARPGTRVIVRGGRLTEPMHVVSSGTPVDPIVIAPQPGETVRVTRVDSRAGGEVYGPVWLDEVSHVVISGFTVSDSVGFGRITGGGSNRVEDFRFEGTRLGLGSESKRGGLYITHSDGNVIRGNLFRSGTDSLSLVASDRNVIEGNRFVDAGHTTLALKCSSYNIVRGNTFANKVQKTVEIYDCSKSTMAWHGNGRFRTDAPRYGRTQRNLVEGNTFTMTGRNEEGRLTTSDASGIQYAGQDGMLRRNVFTGLAGSAFGMHVYAEEAPENRGNRVYHNVVTKTRCGALTMREGVDDNRFVNNVFYGNEACAGGAPVQIAYRDSDLYDGTTLTHNVIWAGTPGARVFGYEFGDAGFTLSEAEHAVFERIFFNYEVDPGLDAHQRPLAGSAVVDAGMFLTRVTADGTSNVVVLEDARYFHAGLGVAGEPGDLVQLEGETLPLRVMAIDLDTGALTLERAVSAKRGQGVSLAYRGKAPDIGAFEFSP